MQLENTIKIQTVFGDSLERNCARLSEIYQDSSKLKHYISELTKEHLSEPAIRQRRILLKPNWVTHSRTPADDVCMRTHDNFVLSALRVVAEKKPSHIVIGDAPIQGCKWNEMLSGSFCRNVDDISKYYNVPVEISDFRRATFDPAKNNPLRDLKPIAEYIIFDLGQESLLDAISPEGKNIFRVTQYNPAYLAASHKRGMHKYCITKALFNADVIISLPKIKTHQKAGITAALKNIVGLNGDKDCLPHHRKGGTDFGGDCYPGGNYLRYFSELLLDNANVRRGRASYWFWLKLASVVWKSSLPKRVHSLGGAWYGNDTVWRMVLDLNRIAIHGKADGSLSTSRQRDIFSLCDGIIGGQGDGPLRPDPLPLGMISFSGNSALTDACMAAIMRLNVSRIPLVTNAIRSSEDTKWNIVLNNEKVSMNDLKKYSISAAPPPGWADYLEM